MDYPDIDETLCCIQFNECGNVDDLIEKIGQDNYDYCFSMGYIYVDGDRWRVSRYVKAMLRRRHIIVRKVIRKNMKLITGETRRRIERSSLWNKLRYWYCFHWEICIYYKE